MSRKCREGYRAIEQEMFRTLGYRDYLGAFQQYRVKHPYEHRLMSMSSYILDYPFANRLYPGTLDVLERFRRWGPTVILTDGDAIPQPRKLQRSGIYDAVDGRVLIYRTRGLQQPLLNLQISRRSLLRRSLGSFPLSQAEVSPL